MESNNKLTKKISDYGFLVMFSHSIFSLSFGLVSMLMTYLITETPTPFYKFILALIALLSARTGANSINRVIDANIDAKNPRTAERHIPAGTVSKKEATVLSIVCFIILVITSFFINPLCGILSPVALFFLVTYSYTKRFTWLCHYYLGFTCAIATMGGYLAISGGFYDIYPFVMFIANMLWVAGFDIIYGCQDYDFDTANGIHSVPAQFGVPKALVISSVTHFFSIVFLLILPQFYSGFGIVYYITILIIAALLCVEHYIVRPGELKNAKIASYSINQVVAIVFLVGCTFDLFF